MVRGSSALLRMLACVIPLLLLPACKAAMSPSYAGDAVDGSYDEYEYEYDGGGGAYDEDYAVEGDMAYDDAPEPEPMSEPPARRTIAVERSSPGAKRRQKVESRRERRADKNVAQPEGTSPPGDGSEGGEGRVDVEAPEPDETPAPAAKKRQIIYTATMQVSVYDLDNALAIAESLPSRYGGWMHQRVDNQLVLRIPAEHLEAAMTTIAELGVVEQRLLEALDVTAEYTDLESRLRVLEQMQTHLADLLKRANSVEQALEIRRVLDEITLELEAARAQMRELAKSIAFSTLILRFTERGPSQGTPDHNDPFPWVDQLGVEATDYR